MLPRRILLALSLVAALVVPVALAPAQDAKPTPCNGILLKDAAGDQDVAPIGGGGAGLPHSSVGPDNIDLRSLFFNYAPNAEGKPVLTANIGITNLTSEVPAEAHEGEVRYLVDFDTLGDVSSLTAILSADGWRFTANIPTIVGVLAVENLVDIKGKVFEGKDGIIQMEMPDSAGVKPGTAMSGVISRVSLGDNTVIFVSDQTPDGGVEAAVDYTVKECPAPGSTPTPPASDGPSTPPSGGPPNQPPAGQPGAGLLPVGGTLAVDVAVDKGKRSTARKRGLRARIRCSVQCKASAVATVDKKTARKLKLGNKAVAIGKGAGTITKPGRIPFFLKLTGKAKKALARKGVRKFGLTVTFKVTDLQGNQLKTMSKKSTLR